MYAIRSYYELIQNAIDATTDSIDVSIRYDQGLKAAIVAVSDRGDGMPREIIEDRLQLDRQRVQDRRLEGAAEPLRRITSYNVCYTKLLRILKVCHSPFRLWSFRRE